VLRDTDDRNDVFEQWYDECKLDTWVDSPIFRCLRVTFLPMLVTEHAGYPKPDEDNPLLEAPLPAQERHKYDLPSAPPPQKAVLLYPLVGHVRHWKWWLTKYLAEYVDNFHMYAEMGNDE
jgi:hypothetical protein